MVAPTASLTARFCDHCDINLLTRCHCFFEPDFLNLVWMYNERFIWSDLLLKRVVLRV